jgi:serine/threonine protein kinase
MPADPKLVRDLFLAAAELPTADRSTYLADHCGQDAELRAAVERLLAAHEQPASVLDRPAPGMPTAEFKPINERPGMMVGPYRLMEQIGEGGFGLVFVAEQTEPVKRKVALKVIKPGMDSKQVIARFEAERQALAVMDHPNIARVLDAGTTASGLPYFVMELVRGIPITDYCDKNQLTPNDRLELFISVCHAIQHAHQKGIIHRDIKPSNVLVGSHDGKPVAKVIDFGVAKAISQDLTQRTIYTNFAQIIGTPLYMSPEQAEMSVLDIDTRSDIYSLGVLLYELLTGSTPLDKKRFARAAYDEIRRMIREDEPPKPSDRLSTCDTLPSVAASRRTEPAKLSRMLKGELDWVVMKALEKDRTRRYETANGLARDIQHYLNDEVVEARPPSAGYRMSKFVRRHKGQVMAASLVLLTLLAGIAGTTWGLIAAKRQEQVARVQAQIARQEAAEKEKARRAEAERVKERDAALVKEAERVKERDAALDNANHQLDNSNFLLAVAAYDNSDVSMAHLRLDGIQAKHRGWEWHYLRRQCTGGIFTLYGHTNMVWDVALSPDGTRVVTGSDDGTARVWDARTGTPPLELKGHRSAVWGVAFSADGTRIVTGSADGTAKVWDARTGAPLLELKGHTGAVNSVALGADGTRIVTGSADGTAKVWDAPTGPELKGEEPLGAVERDYRLLHTRPNLWRYREGYEAARAAQDDFAARFFLNLLPPPEQENVKAQDAARQEIIDAQDAADREIAAGRIQDALVPLATLSAAKPDDTELFLKLAALQAWFGRDKELADTCRRGLAAAQDTTVPETADRVAKACCLLPSTGKAQVEGALALARDAIQLGEASQNRPFFLLVLGMAEYRTGQFAQADAALIAAASAAQNNSHIPGTAAFYRAMSLFQQGRKLEARQLATEAAAKMRPLPKDEKNPLTDGMSDAVILWLAYKEAKGMIRFDAAPTAPATPDGK